MVVRALILGVLCSVVVSAQPRVVDSNLHAWIGYFGDHPVSERWGIHFDAQWRRHDLFSDWQQYVVRPGVNFELSDSVTLTAGYLFSEGFPYGDFPSAGRAPEHRLYQQAAVRYEPSARLSLSQRFRLEQRFLGRKSTEQGVEGIEYRRRNRFRYQLGAKVPLGNSDSRWYVANSEEIMANFGKKARTLFDQNRVYAGLGRRAGRWGRIESGYLHQFIQQGSRLVYESNHTLQFRWSSSAPLW